MPPTGRRRGRKDLEAPTSDVPTPEASSTPSRKRRRVNGADKTSKPATQRARSHESDATIEHPDELNGNEDEDDPFVVAEECIRHLKVTVGPKVNVSVDYNNDIVEKSAQAYAKIAGRQWTYYVSDTRVVIGRPNAKNEKSKHSRPSEGSDGAGGSDATENFKIDIDLGPDQQISRRHAEIQYSTDSENWVISCIGRNGLFLDDERLERGHRKYLRSGAVIGILGTQMMFLLPAEPPVVHPLVKKQLMNEEEDQDEDADDAHRDLPHSASQGRGGRQPNSSFQAASTGKGASSSRPAQNMLATSSSQAAPGTPTISRSQPQPKSNKQSPIYARGLMLESTEEIDYSLDSAKDIKPPFSYAQMIGQAILSSPDENATLSKIYDYIRERYAFFRHNGAGWQNSIRHNLSLSKSFEKIPRRTDEPGKGMKWRIVDEFREEFVKKTMVQAYRKQPLVHAAGRSGPNSPANIGLGGATAQTERLVGAIGESTGSPNMRSSPLGGRSTTPPPQRFSYPSAHESFTPERGPTRPSIRTSNLPTGPNGLSGNSAELVTPGRIPIFAPNSVGPANRGAFNFSDIPNSPSSQFYDGTGIFTPVVHRTKPSMMAQQSTVKMPSHYAKDLFSSPAPFWKYVDMGSTPARPPPNLDFSPTKTELKSEDEQKDDEKHADLDDDDMEDIDSDENVKVDEKAELDAMKTEKTESETDEAKNEPSIETVQPSSPPGNDDEVDASPSRTISRPVSHAGGSLPAAKAITLKALQPTQFFPPPPAQPAFGKPLNMRDMGPAINPYKKKDCNDDDDEEEIDLAK